MQPDFDAVEGRAGRVWSTPGGVGHKRHPDERRSLACSGQGQRDQVDAGGASTFAESGYPDIDSSLNMGLFAPAGTPPEVVNAIAAKAREVINDPAFRAKYVDELALEAAGDNSTEFAGFIAKDKPLQKKRIELSGAQLD